MKRVPDSDSDPAAAAVAAAETAAETAAEAAATTTWPENRGSVKPNQNEPSYCIRIGDALT